MYYLFIMRQGFVCLFVYVGKIPGLRRFWPSNNSSMVFDSKLHTRLAIVTANELGLAFPPRNFPKKFVQIRPRFI